jgi:uroporphyrin-III C-methyltransferase / precorrin-2 dehydrogenase / sirohydrochlorin ferrochelatase
VHPSLPIICKFSKFLLIGAGPVAEQKLEVLHKNSISPTIIAKENVLELENVILKDIEITDCEGFEVIIDASGSNDVRTIVFEAKKRFGALLNRVDIPDDCDFFFASLAYFGDLKVAVTTNGASPTIGQEVRSFIQRSLPKKLAQLTAEKKDARLLGHIDANKTRVESKKLLSHVYLVGCGIGDVELLTLKAYRIIQDVDVVLIDHLISQEIIDIIPESVRKIDVGKQKGKLVVTQERINEILLEEASKGLKVARLKSGDPYIFGRGAEEAIYLSKEGIRVDVVPGISSAIAAPLSAGIAPTARGYSANLSIVTAHLRDNRINVGWIEILKMKNHTTIVLMAVSKATEIVEKALEIGADKDLPTAIISNASRDNQEVTITTLEKLPEHAKVAKRPAIIVFGEVVNLHDKLPILYGLSNDT